MTPKPPHPTDEDGPVDDLKHSFYLRAIRTRIGEELRGHFELPEPLPDRFAALLKELDEEQDGAAPVVPKSP
jgi:hypothetical protein